MIDLLFEIMHEINMTTSNLIYFISGALVYLLVDRIFHRDDPVLWLYTSATDLFNSIRPLIDADKSVLNVYNETLIRSICILAMNGTFATRDLLFIDNACTSMSALTADQRRIVKEHHIAFIDKVVEYRMKMSGTFSQKFTNLIIRRRSK